MSTYILWIVIAYSSAQGGDPGGAALTTIKQEFFTMEQCKGEEKKAIEELKQFKRVSAWCMARPEPGEELFNLKPGALRGQKDK
jgi:hypothetical protein